MDEISVFEYRSAQGYLNALFDARRNRNRRYSQRAFAYAIGLSSAMLNYVQKGQRRISRKLALNIARKLNFDERAQAHFVLSSELDSANDPTERRTLLAHLGKLGKRIPPKTLPEARFDQILHPHFMTILEACALEPVGQTEVIRIADQLKMPDVVVRGILNTQRNLGLLEQTADGAYRRLPIELAVEAPSKKTKLDLVHRQALDQARAALRTSPIEERVFASVYLPIRKERIGEFRSKIYALLDELHEGVDEEKEPDAVYGLTVGFFKTLEKEKER